MRKSFPPCSRTSAKRAIIRASIASVLAATLCERAKERTNRGLTSGRLARDNAPRLDSPDPSHESADAGSVVGDPRGFAVEGGEVEMLFGNVHTDVDSRVSNDEWKCLCYASDSTVQARGQAFFHCLHRGGRPGGDPFRLPGSAHSKKQIWNRQARGWSEERTEPRVWSKAVEAPQGGATKVWTTRESYCRTPLGRLFSACFSPGLRSFLAPTRATMSRPVGAFRPWPGDRCSEANRVMARTCHRVANACHTMAEPCHIWQGLAINQNGWISFLMSDGFRDTALRTSAHAAEPKNVRRRTGSLRRTRAARA